ncbi:MAG: hypothetical protein AB1508_11425 [Pseudomonadota bacterium]
MLRALSFGLFILFATAVQAFAACTLPYTLANGQTADASQVMANFTAINNCLSAGANFTGGYLNKFRNGTMDVWQRGTSGTATTTVSPSTQTAADGWYVMPAGGNVPWSQASGRGPTLYSLKVNGGATIGDIAIKQRIESFVAAPLEGQTVTVQAEIYNNTGATITPALTVKHAGAADAWTSSTTDVNAVSLQPCPNGSWTQVAYTFTASSSSGNGLEITFDFGNNFSLTSSSVQISEADVRSTPGATVGLNNTPPAPELRPISVELPFCQRYFEISTGLPGYPTPNSGSSANTWSPSTVWTFAVQMRASPTITISGWRTPATPQWQDYVGVSGSNLRVWNSGDATKEVTIDNNAINVTWTNGAQPFVNATASAEL